LFSSDSIRHKPVGRAHSPDKQIRENGEKIFAPETRFVSFHRNNIDQVHKSGIQQNNKCDIVADFLPVKKTRNQKQEIKIKEKDTAAVKNKRTGIQDSLPVNMRLIRFPPEKYWKGKQYHPGKNMKKNNRKFGSVPAGAHGSIQ
jgi:hypothetical protein